jgi:hypothetical protein
MIAFSSIQSQTINEDIILKLSPNPLELDINEEIALSVEAIDKDGNILKGKSNLIPLKFEGLVRTSGIEVTDGNMVVGKIPGQYRLIVMWGDEEGNFQREYLNTTVNNAPVASIEISNIPDKIYSGSVVPLNYTVKDNLGFPVENAKVKISWQNSKIAEVDVLDNLYAKSNGKTTVSFQIGDISSKISINVLENPVTRLEISSKESTVKTGDVIPFSANSWDKKGKKLEDIRYTYSVNSAENEFGTGASAIIEQDGRMVAEVAGYYTVVASVGDKSSQKTIKVIDRDVVSEVVQVGHGSVTDKHTSDLWIWEGEDGGDYAVTGTWGADGKAYFWDVTDPAKIIKIDSVQVDARTVNDVKISEDGKVCVITREGASSRKNGIVILDVTNPRDVKEHSVYTDGLTGGVHNVFIYENHVYALSNGQKYEIINIEDPKNPYRVGHFELDKPNRSIHDVWIVEGIAYSSNWGDGIFMVDVGNGIAGGSPSNPVIIANSKVQGDANHAAFPYRSKSTGKFYVIAGDEIFPASIAGKPDFDMQAFNPSGYLHILDFTDPKNPKEVARYEVPEAGSHNLWVEDDILYVGYYNGGVRIVDLSGDLMGDLYKQGREIGHFIPKDPKGYVKNHAMTWGAQPHKGHVFFSDFNSGLWSVKVVPNSN